MIFEAGYGFKYKFFRGLYHDRVKKRISEGRIDYSSFRNKLSCASQSFSLKSPARSPVWPAHMPRKKCNIKPQSIFLRGIAYSLQILQRTGYDRIRRNLKILPKKKYSHQIHSIFFNQRKIFTHLIYVEVGPPAHRLAPWPVIYTQNKRLTHLITPIIITESISKPSPNSNIATLFLIR